MQHSIVYKNKNKYASFPLLTKLDDRILIGFFTAPVPDHMGIYDWKVMQSTDECNSWRVCWIKNLSYNWPSASPRETSDRFAYQLGKKKIITGSSGFKKREDFEGNIKEIHKSKHLFIRSSDDNWKTINERFYKITNANIVCSFPRPLEPRNEYDPIRLIPVYAAFKNGLNRALAWRSDDFGRTWQLYNMFPNEVNANEVAFIWTLDGILAHIRSDEYHCIMESRSIDGITWTYPTNIQIKNNRGYIFGGPSHLLGLEDGRILCTYGYRQLKKMGIRTIISDNGGDTWSDPIILRDDGGYLSNLHEKKWFWQKKTHPGNDVGYPISIQLDDGEILTAYYITTRDRITSIVTTKWRIE